jgi:hypothetical protein
MTNVSAEFGMIAGLAYFDLQRAIAVTTALSFKLFLRESTTRFDLFLNYLYDLLYYRVKYFFPKFITIAV